MSPINFRPVLAIKKGIDVDGMGLFTLGLLRLYNLTHDPKFLQDANHRLNFLKTKSLQRRCSEHCWSGQYFEYQGVNSRCTPEIPETITTAMCGSAFLEYYKLNGEKKSLEIARSSVRFLINNVYVNNGNRAFFKYRPVGELNSHVYNASTRGVMLLCNISKYIKDNKNLEIARKVMDCVISRQKSNGVWYYSETNGKEKVQIDFHQGFILDDLHDFIKYVKPSDDKYIKALLKGAEFYKDEQFLSDGRAKWRWPRVYPIDIHNQAQGIITFSKLSEIKPEYLDFAITIAKWTIENMQDKTGYFYYQKWPFFTNKIPYMRWGQASMMLALSILLKSMDISDPYNSKSVPLLKFKRR